MWAEAVCKILDYLAFSKERGLGLGLMAGTSRMTSCLYTFALPQAADLFDPGHE